MTNATPPPPPLPPYPGLQAGPTPPPPLPGSGLRPPLRRSRTDKVLGGVSGGLAEYTGIDALLWRVGFIALVFAGGTGILVYLLLWLLMPVDRSPAGPADEAPARPAGPRSPVPGITVATLLIVVGVMALVARTTSWRPGPVGFLAAALVVVGIGLGVGAFLGGRSSRGPLIALGVVLSFALLLASVTDGWRGGGHRVGDLSYTPATVAAVQPRYESGVGDVSLDLSRLDLSGLARPVSTMVDGGLGDIDVVVPRSADVRVSVQNGLGSADVFGQSSDGGYFAGTGSAPWTGDGVPEIVLTVSSGVGDVTVSRG